MSCGDRCPWAPVRPVLVLVATVVRVKRAPVRPGLVLVLWRRPLPAVLFAGAGAASLVVAGTPVVVGDTIILGEAIVDVMVCTYLVRVFEATLTSAVCTTPAPIFADCSGVPVLAALKKAGLFIVRRVRSSRGSGRCQRRLRHRPRRRSRRRLRHRPRRRPRRGRLSRRRRRRRGRGLRRRLTCHCIAYQPESSSRAWSSRLSLSSVCVPVVFVALFVRSCRGSRSPG